MSILSPIASLCLTLYFKAYSKEPSMGVENYDQPWHVRPTLFQRLKLSFLEQTEAPLNFIRWFWNPAFGMRKAFSDPVVNRYEDLPYKYADQHVSWDRTQFERFYTEFEPFVSANPNWLADRDLRRSMFNSFARNFQRKIRTERDCAGLRKTNLASYRWEALSFHFGVPVKLPSANALAPRGLLEELDSIGRYPDFVSNWLSRGLNINSTCALGRTPLHYAMVNAQVDDVRDLLNAGADPSATDVYGDTPLHAVAKFWGGKQSDDVNEVIELLLAHGADPNQPNREGLTAHDIADFQALNCLDRRDRLQDIVDKTRPATVEAAPRRAM